MSPRGLTAAEAETMGARLAHRGPDGDGLWRDPYATLVHRRLAVIDPAGGAQPIASPDGATVLVFNGEIYNHPELRRELEARGATYRTDCDTETVLHAFRTWGDDCVHRLRGMYAFAVWDGRRRRLFAARDRLGKKPLLWTVRNGRFAFASEMKALLALPDTPREISPEALHEYLRFSYVRAPRTIIAGIHKLPAGHALELVDGRVRTWRYWTPAPAAVARMDAPAWAEALRAKLLECVRLRLRADVPLGAFLSGGIDSSIVVAAMARAGVRRIRTFSIAFDDPTLDESAHARTVARHFGTEHHETLCRPDPEGLARSLATVLDEPFADASAIPTLLVSEVARREVTVALAGDGGDELFGGYDTYIAEMADRVWRHLPRWSHRLAGAALSRLRPSPAAKGPLNVARRFVEGAARPPRGRHLRWMTFFDDGDLPEIYARPDLAALAHADIYEDLAPLFGDHDLGEEEDPLRPLLTADLRSWIPDDILYKVDIASMARSLEVRTPFLDHEFVELALAAPSHLKIRGRERKWILRRAFEADLPPAILARRDKKGFMLPIRHWLRGPLRPLVLDLLSPAALAEGGHFRPRGVARLIDEHLSGRRDRWHEIWALLVFEMWRREYRAC